MKDKHIYRFIKVKTNNTNTNTPINKTNKTGNP